MNKNKEMPVFYNGSGLEYIKPFKKDFTKEHVIKPINAVKNNLQFPVFPNLDNK
ncbi:hypothetical protein [Mesobacillus campisalis]|uniref:hypothetical protein n=1 Tax=Mesobacillus campisalis TaxID=1408103 RepID=UPI000A5EF8E3|nr:hypothetical protein [Mesobacillus campisalis]